MLNKKRTAIVFTANSPHVAHANLMLDSLTDPAKGNFSGDIWVISTGLSERAKNYLDSRGIKYLVSSLSGFYSWEHWKKVAEAQPEYVEALKQNVHTRLTYAFEAYRNKRMSKLILLDWVNKFKDKYDFIALGDNDLYFQKDIHTLFESAYKSNPDKIHYWREENKINPGSWLWKKDFHYSRYYDTSSIDFGSHEINIGFILGKPGVLYQAFSDVKKSFLKLNVELFTKYQWHDQDLVRLNKALNPERYTLLQEGDIVHLCNGGEDVIEEPCPYDFYHKRTHDKPYIIHFAGGAWGKFSSIKDTYSVKPDDYYFSWETRSEYDSIRQGSLINIFDETSDKYFTEDNKESKLKSRKKWLEVTKNGKKNFLFIGWLQTSIHKSTYQALPDFFNSPLYNLAVLNGNVTKTKYDNLICEDFPIILSELTRITKDIKLIRIFGIHLEGVPEVLFQDCIKSVIAEYRCTERTARAVANLTFLYFSEALDFYRPDLVLLWGMLSPWGKMIKSICQWKHIPISSLEWGVLPGTAAFDFCGHMGESWVARNTEYFNKLAINPEDLRGADDYLQIAGDPSLSRNTPSKISEDVYEYLHYLKQKGKKIILYMESNSAHSGNMLSDKDASRRHSPFYIDDRDAYKDVLEICKKHPEWHIVYKPHPISLTRGIQPEIDVEYTTVLYSGGLNEALDLADMSITILSQSAYVSFIKKVPVLLLGNIQLNGSGSAYVLDDKKNLESIIAKALSEGITAGQKELFREHVARILKYYVYSAHNKVAARDSSLLSKNLVSILDDSNESYYQFERDSYCSQAAGSRFTNDEEPSVSIIMPVYNAGEYLSACISSLLNQTLTSIELICINNGSTDDSQEVLEYYAKKDARIKLHYQEEPNQRSARNWGIDHAKGKYIYLMDSDDYLDPEALRTLKELAENKNADLLYFFFREVRTDMNTVRPRPRYFNYRKFFPDEKLFPLSESLYKFFIQYPFPWAKLMRRDFVLENSLYFDLDCSNFDDNPHNLRVLLSAKNPYVYHQQFYNFRIHSKSMTQSTNPRIIGMLDAVRIMNNIYREKGVYAEFQKWYVPYKIHILAWAWDLLPDNLREQYFESVPALFTRSDIMWFDHDEVWSYYEMPASQYVIRIKNMLTLEYSKFLKCEAEMRSRQKGGSNLDKENLKRTLSKYPKLYSVAKSVYKLGK